MLRGCNNLSRLIYRLSEKCDRNVASDGGEGGPRRRGRRSGRRRSLHLRTNRSQVGVRTAGTRLIARVSGERSHRVPPQPGQLEAGPTSMWRGRGEPPGAPVGLTGGGTGAGRTTCGVLSTGVRWGLQSRYLLREIRAPPKPRRSSIDTDRAPPASCSSGRSGWRPRRSLPRSREPSVLPRSTPGRCDPPARA